MRNYLLHVVLLILTLLLFQHCTTSDGEDLHDNGPFEYGENLAVTIGGLATASSNDPGLDLEFPSDPSHAFDTYSSSWTSVELEELPQWLQFDFGDGNEQTVQMYGLYITQWGTPRTWAFQGSNDAINWTILDTREVAHIDPFKTSHFEIKNNLAYRYYRLHVTYATGLTNHEAERDVNFVTIRELELRSRIN